MATLWPRAEARSNNSPGLVPLARLMHPLRLSVSVYQEPLDNL
jgi:hypothetical protein